MATATALTVGLIAMTLPTGDAHAFELSRLTLRGGAGYIGGDPGAFQAGVGVGYQIKPWLESGLTVDGRFPTEDTAPRAWLVGPYATAFVPLPIIKPYAGLFYRHWFLSDFEIAGINVSLDDLDSWGWRAGVLFASGPGLSLSLGLVNERFFDCEGDGCSDFYPEFGVRFSL
jgi:hypothetical protein